jgi:purine-binding chemotaxis protein CheW
VSGAENSPLLLTFLLAAERYALPAMVVREIVHYRPPEPVPGAPPWVLGLITTRGEVVPVVDLAWVLGLPPRPVTPLSCLIVLELRAQREPLVMALLADEAEQTLPTPEDEPAPPDEMLGERVKFLRGIWWRQFEPLLLLDPARVVEELTDAELGD